MSENMPIYCWEANRCRRGVF